MRRKLFRILSLVVAVVLISVVALSSCAKDKIDSDDTWRDKWDKLIVTREKKPEFVAARFSLGDMYEYQTYGITNPEKPGTAREDHTIIGEVLLEEDAIKILLKELKKVDIKSFEAMDPEYFTEEAKYEFQDMPYLDIRIVVDSTLVKQAYGTGDNAYNNDTNSGYKYALRIFIHEDGHVYIRDYIADVKYASSDTVDFGKLKALISQGEEGKAGK